jgi:hypothetical protein
LPEKPVPAKKNRGTDIHQGFSVPNHILKIAALFVVASMLPGCGGGEGYEDLADTTRMGASEHEPPGRGPEWLLPPSEEGAPSAG